MLFVFKFANDLFEKEIRVSDTFAQRQEVIPVVVCSSIVLDDVFFWKTQMFGG